jgi:hypothetical protein
MKASEEEDFENFDAEAIRHYNICDCLDLFRKLQFLGLADSREKKHLVKSLELRIITLVMPHEGRSPITFDLRPGSSNRK